jgi:hypothetical protein
MDIMKTQATALVLACVGLALTNITEPVVAAPQRLAMMRAEWRDLERWSHYNEGQRQNELGLGLQLAGPSGMTFLAFTGVLSVSYSPGPPSEVGIQVALPKFAANPNAVRRPTLLLVADPETDKTFRLDLTPKLEVDDPTPGGGVENGATMMRASEFVRLAESKKLGGQVLGLEASFREDQLAAMRKFAEALHLKVKAPSD